MDALYTSIVRCSRATQLDVTGLNVKIGFAALIIRTVNDANRGP